MSERPITTEENLKIVISKNKTAGIEFECEFLQTGGSGHFYIVVVVF